MKYIVPEGCYFRSVAGVEFNAGEKLPDNYRLKKGDMLLSQDYHYDYLGRNIGGWHVHVKHTTKTSYGTILSEIAGKPMTNMDDTFIFCESLTTAPAIPNSVTNMGSTFVECHSLTTATTIPNSVINMYGTFMDCKSLKKPPVIPKGVVSMNFAFKDCISLEEKPKLPSTAEYDYEVFSGTPFDKSQEILEPEIDASEPEQDEEER